MHNLGTVISFEFFRTIKKKSFWLGTLMVPALISVILLLSYFSGVSSSQADEKLANERFSVIVDDGSGLVRPDLLASLGAKTVTNKSEGISQVKAGTVDAFFYYPASPSTDSIEVYAKDDGLVQNGKYTRVAESLLKLSVSEGIDSKEKVAIIQGAVTSELTTYTSGEKVPGFERVIAPGFVLVLFYLIIVLLSNQMITSTTEEKENRVIEMLLTSVKAQTLIVGKVITLFMLGILQMLVISLPVVVALVFFSDKLNLPSLRLSDLPIDPVSMTIAIAVFLSSFILFTGLLVAIGAAMPTAKEASQFFGPVIASMFIPLYAASAIVTSPDQIIVKVFTFFPLTAPVTILLRNATGNLQLWEGIVGTAIILVSGIVMVGIATRAFRYGTLEYDRRLSLKELLGMR